MRICARLSGLMGMLLLLLCVCAGAMAEDASFTISSGGVITGYTGDAEELVVPETINGYTVKIIGSRAFEGASFTSVTLPDTVTAIWSYAFQNCAQLETIALSSSLKSIGGYAFSGCAELTEVAVPEGVSSVGMCAFYKCKGLTSVSLPQSLTSLGSWVFSECASLKDVNIPSGITRIEKDTFYACSSLTVIDLPADLTYIGEWAFALCDSLTLIRIPDKVTEIADYALMSCSALTQVQLPEALVRIGEYAFSSCRAMTALTIPDTVSEIASNAFYACHGLTEIRIPAAMTEVQYSAFRFCSGIKKLILPEGLLKIGDEAFFGCSGLTAVDIPSTVTSIGVNALPGGIHLNVGGNEYAKQYAVEHGYPYTADSDSGEQEEIDTPEEVAAWVVERYAAGVSTEYEKALRLYRWLCGHVTYDHDYIDTDVPTSEHGVGGEAALLDGWAVCQGYAEAYEMLLETAGIDAEYVTGSSVSSGEGHAWNLAKIDGKWYQFDATWDDGSSGNQSYTYFGLTDNAMRVSHVQEDMRGIVCNSWDANYKYRSGAYDGALEAVRDAIEMALADGLLEGSAEYSMNSDTDSQMIADILSGSTGWSTEGSAEVTSLGGGAFEFVFHPEKTPVRSIVLEGVDIKADQYLMYPGYSVQLTAVTEPAGASLIFETTDDTVITVSDEGLLTAVGTGTAELIVRAVGCKYTLSIEVRPTSAFETVFFVYDSGDDQYLDIGDSAHTYVSANARKLLLGAPVWTSADERVAVVDENGVVTGVGYGETTVGFDWFGERHELAVVVQMMADALQIAEPVYHVTVGDTVSVAVEIACGDAQAYAEKYGDHPFTWMYTTVGLLTQTGSDGHTAQMRADAPGITEIMAAAVDKSGLRDSCVVCVHDNEQMFTLPQGLKAIEAEAFAGSAALEFVLPEGIESIGSRAFADCASLQMMVMPENIGYIAADAFEGCTSLTMICKTGSYAQQYAEENGLNVILVP